MQPCRPPALPSDQAFQFWSCSPATNPRPSLHASRPQPSSPRGSRFSQRMGRPVSPGQPRICFQINATWLPNAFPPGSGRFGPGLGRERLLQRIPRPSLAQQIEGSSCAVVHLAPGQQVSPFPCMDARRRFLNSYTRTLPPSNGKPVAAGPRFLNSYTSIPGNPLKIKGFAGDRV